MHQHVNSNELENTICIWVTSESLDEPSRSCVKHMLGCGPNTKMHTMFGMKDTFQDTFIKKITTLSYKLTGVIAAKQKAVD